MSEEEWDNLKMGDWLMDSVWSKNRITHLYRIHSTRRALPTDRIPWYRVIVFPFPQSSYYTEALAGNPNLYQKIKTPSELCRLLFIESQI